MTTRHWKLIQGFALAALLPLCVACSSEDDNLPQNEDKQPVQVNITRATMNDGNDWSWQNNDQVGLSINGTTRNLTYNNGSWAPAITGINLPATAEAWWPSTASTSEFSFQHDSNSENIFIDELPPITLDGTVDQSSTEKLAQNDWMTSGQITIGSLSADLTLRHRLAKVTVTITSSEIVNEVKFLSYTLNKIDYNYATIPYVGITPYATGNNTYTAIVSPYYYNQGNTPFMWVTVGDDTAKKIVYLPRNLGTQGSLSPGMAYTFNLTVNNAATRSTGISECMLDLVEVQDMNENR